jgi:hypothetical protein
MVEVAEERLAVDRAPALLAGFAIEEVDAAADGLGNVATAGHGAFCVVRYALRVVCGVRYCARATPPRMQGFPPFVLDSSYRSVNRYAKEPPAQCRPCSTTSNNRVQRRLHVSVMRSRCFIMQLQLVRFGIRLWTDIVRPYLTLKIEATANCPSKKIV